MDTREPSRLKSSRNRLKFEREVAGSSTSWTWLVLRQAFGWSLLGIGIAGLALPILPGWLLIGWGVVTLAADVPFFRRLLDRIEQKAPQLKSIIARMKQREKSSSSAGDGAG